MMETPSHFPRDTQSNPPTSVFPHAGFLPRVARVTEPRGGTKLVTEKQRVRPRGGEREKEGERLNERRRGLSLEVRGAQ